MNKIDELFSGKCHLLPSTLEAFKGYLVEENPLLNHAEETLIARFPKSPLDGDGQPVEIYCSAYPAEFFEIRALKARDSVGKAKKAFKITTGSGMSGLVREIALAIADGMINVES